MAEPLAALRDAAWHARPRHDGQHTARSVAAGAGAHSDGWTPRYHVQHPDDAARPACGGMAVLDTHATLPARRRARAPALPAPRVPRPLVPTPVHPTLSTTPHPPTTRA